MMLLGCESVRDGRFEVFEDIEVKVLFWMLA